MGIGHSIKFSAFQYVYEFARSACHMYHTCQRGLYAHVPTCQHDKSMPISYFYVLMCQRHANISTWHANLPNACQCFNLYAKVLNVCQCLNLACHVPKRIPFFNFQLFFKRIRKWCIRRCLDTCLLKPYQPKTFDVILNGGHRINNYLASVKWRWQYFFSHIFFYAVCKKVD